MERTLKVQFQYVLYENVTLMRDFIFSDHFGGHFGFFKALKVPAMNPLQ